MTLSRRPRRGFTLTELLVVIAIVAVLIGLLVPAVQRVRDAAARAECQSNLHQLIVAVHNFQNTKGHLPVYFGIDSTLYNDSTPGNDPSQPFGSWFLHLMPFVEQEALYRVVADSCQLADNNTGAYYSFGGGPLISAGSPGYYDYTNSVWVPGTPPVYGPPTWVQEDQNGYIVWVLVQNLISPGTPSSWQPPPVWVPPVPAVYGPPGPPYADYSDIWNSQVHGATYKILQCRSDPTLNSNGTVFGGYWGGTSYMANWNAFCASAGDASNTWGPWSPEGGFLGWWTPAQNLLTVTDGLSNTIFFGEGYQTCDGVGRIALYSGEYSGYEPYQSFGLTGVVLHGGLDGGTLPPDDYYNGLPNTFRFQIKPLPYDYAHCPKGADCCSNWMTQTGHDAMNVAMGDGSVRSLSSTVSPRAWAVLVLPQDGKPIPED
jgi:prepilin-type N-terminal cleavage/methylation domain-containing protein